MSQIPDEYWERAFQIWYASGQPTGIEDIRNCLPDFEGDRPANTTIRKAMQEYGWSERADAMNTLAVQKVEEDLVTKRADMFRKQLEEAREIKQIALDHIRENGFDNSSSAVNALFKAIDTESKVTGVEELINRISQMSVSKLNSRAQALLKRKNEALEGEVEEIDAENNTTAE